MSSNDSQLPTPTPTPGFNGKVTRVAGTEASYLRRAMGFEARTSRELSILDPAPHVVAAYALEMRGEWSKSTWRQMKASLMYRYAQMGTSLALEAVSLLRDVSQSDCPRTSTRTSGRRAKKVTPDDLQAVLDGVNNTRSEYAGLLCTWLLLGAQIGLRPHEWGQSELIHALPSDVGDAEPVVQDAAEAPDSGSPTPLPYLRVRNGKDTNGRSHGEFRHLNLSGLSPGLIEEVGKFASLMAAVVARREYARYYMGCRKLLLRVNKELHADDAQRWVQLYSARHKFSAEAKKALDRQGVAALMGHATTKTAGQHYGRRISATGGLGPRPVAAEIARVRAVRAYQARTAQPAAAPNTPPKPSTKG